LLLTQSGLHPPPLGGVMILSWSLGQAVVVDGLALLAAVGGGLLMVSASSQRGLSFVCRDRWRPVWTKSGMHGVAVRPVLGVRLRPIAAGLR
jgi:hypothetical protein